MNQITWTDIQLKRLKKLGANQETLESGFDEPRERDKAWKKVKKTLPGAKAARYMQIENKLDAIRRVEFAREIPLVEPGTE